MSYPLLVYDSSVVLGTSDDEVIGDDNGEVLGAVEPVSVLVWLDSAVVGVTDSSENEVLGDDAGEVFGLFDPPSVLVWGGVATVE